ncbi:hypothetical protein AB0D10_01210 [Kitasatospora sp. NPDC048545]|uniref:hypothetical protein n=1 Tax=Kitasatospora sp. NPDC048545 TaxID=3157208 RepID=UPI0033DCA688
MTSLEDRDEQDLSALLGFPPVYVVRPTRASRDDSHHTVRRHGNEMPVAAAKWISPRRWEVP